MTWQAYLDIKRGCESVSYTEIAAYSDLMTPLDWWEVEAIRAIEVVRINGK